MSHSNELFDIINTHIAGSGNKAVQDKLERLALRMRAAEQSTHITDSYFKPETIDLEQSIFPKVDFDWMDIRAKEVK